MIFLFSPTVRHYMVDYDGIWTVALKQASVAFACCPPLVHNFNISIISADLHGNGTLYDTRKNYLNSILKIL